jgi:hypothetical protein
LRAAFLLDLLRFMNLTRRQQHALQSICDTFAPASDGWPSASELGIPGSIAKALDFNPRSGERAQFLQLLDVWDTHLHSLLTVGGLRFPRFLGKRGSAFYFPGQTAD